MWDIFGGRDYRLGDVLNIGVRKREKLLVDGFAIYQMEKTGEENV